jgi:spore germination cell wall hydrolase CwlJ-like protein
LLYAWTARAFARAQRYAVPSGAAAGAFIGLALGGAYLAGGMAQDAMADAKASRPADVAEQGSPEPAMADLVTNGGPGAVAVAKRYEGPSASVNVGAAMAVLRGPGTVSQTRELECLTQAVYYEARGETPAGQAAVAQVVLNRVKHPAFPKSVCGVVFQGAQRGRGCQFSFACDGSTRMRREPAAWTRARRIATRAFAGQAGGGVGSATHFHVVSVQPGWAGMIQVAQVGAHIFYRFSGRKTAKSDFGPPAEVIDQLAEPAPTVTTTAPQVILASNVIAPEVVKPEAVVTLATPGKVEAAVVKTEAAPAKAEAAPAKPSAM